MPSSPDTARSVHKMGRGEHREVNGWRSQEPDASIRGYYWSSGRRRRTGRSSKQAHQARQQATAMISIPIVSDPASPSPDARERTAWGCRHHDDVCCMAFSYTLPKFFVVVPHEARSHVCPDPGQPASRRSVSPVSVSGTEGDNST